MSRRSHAAVARSARLDRTLLTLLALLLLAGGVVALLVGTGVLGADRARRPVLDPIAVDFLRSYLLYARIAAIVLGVLLVAVGLWWALRSLRPEPKPDLVLDDSAAGELTVTSSALADAIKADAISVQGVERARARLVGNEDDPALRLTLWLQQGADLRAVWEGLDQQVLSRARQALGLSRLPTAIRLELDAAERQRVH